MYANPYLAKPSLSLIAWLLIFFSGTAFGVPEIEHWTTLKGGRVYYVKTEGLPLVDVRMVFDAGSARDGSLFGLASLTSGMLDSGALDWDADAIAQRLERVGAVLGTGASRDSAYLSLRSLSHPDKLKEALETLKNVVTHPTFAAKDFERERNRVLMAIKQQGEDPGEIAEISFMKTLYGDHPYAHPSEGIRETVEKLTPNDLKVFHREKYTVRNSITVVVGNIDRLAAEALANDLLSGLPEGEVLPVLADPIDRHEALTVKTPSPSEQTHIYSGVLGFRVNDPDTFPLYIGNHILGGSGLVSKIMEEVREKRGLAYSASSYFLPMRVPGPFEIGLQTKNASAEEALDIAVRTVREFIEKGPSDRELEAAKKNIIGGFVLRLDSNQKLISEVASIAFFQRPLDYLNTFTQKVQAVTREDIKRAFKARVNPDQLKTILVGAGGEKPSH